MQGTIPTGCYKAMYRKACLRPMEIKRRFGDHHRCAVTKRTIYYDDWVAVVKVGSKKKFALPHAVNGHPVLPPTRENFDSVVASRGK